MNLKVTKLQELLHMSQDIFYMHLCMVILLLAMCINHNVKSIRTLQYVTVSYSHVAVAIFYTYVYTINYYTYVHSYIHMQYIGTCIAQLHNYDKILTKVLLFHSS